MGVKEDGTMGDLATEIRTSSHGWCNHPECLNDPQVWYLDLGLAPDLDLT